VSPVAPLGKCHIGDSGACAGVGQALRHKLTSGGSSGINAPLLIEPAEKTSQTMSGWSAVELHLSCRFIVNTADFVN